MGGLGPELVARPQGSDSVGLGWGLSLRGDKVPVSLLSALARDPQQPFDAGTIVSVLHVKAQACGSLNTASHKPWEREGWRGHPARVTTNACSGHHTALSGKKQQAMNLPWGLV